jgi:hypothetical protein
MIRFCVIFGLAACAACLGGPPLLALAATSPVPDGPIASPINQGILEPAAEVARPTAPAGHERPAIGNPLWAVPLRSLSATRDRPIFSPSRRPPPAAVAPVSVSVQAPPPKPAEPDHPPLMLVGTIIGDNGGIGVFVDQTTQSVVRLKTGQDHEGWTLRSVRGRDAIFHKDRRTATLSLPPSGTGASAQPGIQVPVGMPGTWMDGDGQLITPPPRRAAQSLPAPGGRASGTVTTAHMRWSRSPPASG